MSYRAVEVPKTIDLLFKLHKSKSTVASLSAGEWFDLIELGGVPGSTSNQEDPCGGPNGLPTAQSIGFRVCTILQHDGPDLLSWCCAAPPAADNILRRFLSQKTTGIGLVGIVSGCQCES
eukprot:m.293861 g.293861  ORF g.293861 m.293861 type:complete len:120 (+) comp27147_c0_seq1:2619-2978(+)